jgi:Methylase involved in ubiquinone/menaquinone biosynthesis
MIDKSLIAESFGRALDTYDRAAIVQRKIVETLADMMTAANFPSRASIYEVGAGTGLMTALLAARFKAREIIANDLCADTAPALARAAAAAASGSASAAASAGAAARFEFISGDAESLPIPPAAEAVVSCSAIQWFADKAAFFKKVAAALPPASLAHSTLHTPHSSLLLAFTTFGPENLREVDELASSGLKYDSAAEYRAMLRAAGFRVIAECDSVEQIFFPNIRALLRHFRETGVGGTGRSDWDFAKTRRFCRDYEAKHRAPAGLALTYHPLYFVCAKEK